jgi:hypothetical protein
MYILQKEEVQRETLQGETLQMIEYLLFGNYPFYMSYVQEFGLLGAIWRLNPIYHKLHQAKAGGSCSRVLQVSH